MIEGKCPNCGVLLLGWALLFPRNQTCPKCGTGLEITENGRPLSEGYSPFAAERYFMNLPNNAPTSTGEAKSEDSQKK